MASSSLKTSSSGKEYGSINETEPLAPKTTACYESSSKWSQLVFGWLSPLLEMGHTQPQLNIKDLDILPLPEQDTTDHVMNTFSQAWRDEQERANEKNVEPSVLKALWVSFSPDFLKAGALKLVHDLLQFVGPQVLNGLILFVKDADAPLWKGISLVVAVTLAQLTMSLCLRHYFFQCYRVGLRVRSAVVMQVYQKALVVASSSHSIGQVTNLMSVDAQRLQDNVTFLHAIWYSFLQIGLAIYFLWKQLGPSCMAGVGVIVLSIPMTAMTASWMGRLQKKLMAAKDARVQTNNEILGNMKIVKLQAWEEAFEQKVQELRSHELHCLFRYFLGRSLTFLTFGAVPLLISLATFATYVISGHTLEVASALTALALFDILRFPLFMLPNVMNNMVEAGVALGRIQSFLSSPEHEAVPTGRLTEEGSIEMVDATFCHDSKRPVVEGSSKQEKALADAEWEHELVTAQLASAERRLAELEGREFEDSKGSTDLLSLCRINFACRPGELIALVGAVGAGKSTFLQGLLGEVRRLSGDVSVVGRVGYLPQTSFIMNDTVKGNILFGKPDNNASLYDAAISACALQHDLELLPKGEMCEIGEKGVTLSGGQKARISLARLVYHDSDIFLLDDPLAAVDANVGRHLFEKCIIDVMLLGKAGNTKKKRTVILVTNALQYLKHPLVNRIVVLKDGSVAETGTYQELTSDDDSHFTSFLASFNESMQEQENATEAAATGYSLEEADTSPRRRRSSMRESIRNSLRESLTATSQERRKSEEVEKPTQMSDEMQERATGAVTLDVYLAWAKAGGGILAGIFILSFYTLSEGTQILSNWWLTYWSHHGSEGGTSTQMHFLALYGVINFSAIIVDFSRTILFMLFGLRASRQMFSDMLSATLRAPMSFYDTTPLGQILNRFSKDMYTLDEALPDACMNYLWTIFGVISTLVVVCAVSPIFAIFLVPILMFYRHQQESFSRTYRELKRLDSVSRSPIYALFGETLDGVATIRAFAAGKPLLKRMVSMVDQQQHAYFLFSTGLCWLAVRLELVGTMIIFLAGMISVFQKGHAKDLDKFAGLAGLSISYALSVTQSLNWAVRMQSDLEANMVAVERLEQYSGLTPEAPRKTEPDDDLPAGWPKHAVITFKNAKMRYRPRLPLVLKGLTLTLPRHSNIGIVGRTGAGKSSLMTTLLRLVELDEGSILIDGVDISTLGLHKLRSKIAVIPQDPILFAGTVKSNLDPFDTFDASHLTKTLQRVGLWKTDQGPSAIKSLDDSVSEGGTNFSVGQRQLLVIARALLCGASVVICDEATAAVDAETDARIQRILRDDFSNATCLTVAHRLNTILDSSDYILVMNNGQAAEFDTPKQLLQKGGLFKQLVDTWEEDHGRDVS